MCRMQGRGIVHWLPFRSSLVVVECEGGEYCVHRVSTCEIEAWLCIVSTECVSVLYAIGVGVI